MANPFEEGEDVVSNAPPTQTTTHYRTCPLCEATCGLELEVADGTVQQIRGDSDDVFSQGFICPKATGLKSLHEDPDRVRTPLIKRNGKFEPATWQEAFTEIERRLTPILTTHGRNAVGVYLGNPNVHNIEAAIYSRVFLKALGTRNIFSASTVDQMPKHVSSGLMFGDALSIPIPDVDRTDFLLILGANPLESNGSLLTAPDLRGRLRKIRERGGRVVVVDPRRTRTAEAADEHHFIRPGTDAMFLFALVNVLFDENLTAPGELAAISNGLDQVAELSAAFAPETVEQACGISASEIRRLARELAAAPSAAVYGRMGTCTQAFGTVSSWLIDVLNVLTGNLDRPGGAMFTMPAVGGANTSGKPGEGRGMAIDRWNSRVRGLPEVMGELPVACMAEEIDTAGEGQIRALFTLAGNPVVSTPNSGRLKQAFGQLDLMVSLDIYINETTSQADVILPAPSALERVHYDLPFYLLSVRNIANFSPAVLERDPTTISEWEQLLHLSAIATGQGADAEISVFDDMVINLLVQREVADSHSPLSGRAAEQLVSELEPRRGPTRVLDWFLRSGPHGDHFGANPDGLTLETLEKAPHGIDLGPLQPRLPELLRTPSGKIELAPAPIVADIDRLIAGIDQQPNDSMVLIGRRQLRSNNSWMHNVSQLVRGNDRCTAQVHPTDASRLGLVDGGPVKITSRCGTITVPTQITDAVMTGVVSVPHGWGHDDPAAQLSVAAQHAGANSNLLADEALTDNVSGNAVLNGIAVELTPAKI